MCIVYHDGNIGHSISKCNLYNLITTEIQHRTLYWVEGDEVKSLMEAGEPRTIFTLPPFAGKVVVSPDEQVFFTKDGGLGSNQDTPFE